MVVPTTASISKGMFIDIVFAKTAQFFRNFESSFLFFPFIFIKV